MLKGQTGFKNQHFNCPDRFHPDQAEPELRRHVQVFSVYQPAGLHQTRATTFRRSVQQLHPAQPGHPRHRGADLPPAHQRFFVAQLETQK